MNRFTYWIGAALVFVSSHASAQLLPNGGFELGSRTPLPSDPYTLNPTTALPSWSFSGSFGGALYYNYFNLGGPVVGIQQSGSLGGNYCMYLQAGYAYYPNSVSLWQSVSIPADARSISYRVKDPYDYAFYPGRIPLTVGLSGQPLTPFLLSSNAAYAVYAIDVASLASSIAELRFTVDATSDPYGGSYLLDEVSFSTEIVPEPSALALCALAVIVLLIRLERAKVPSNSSE